MSLATNQGRPAPGPDARVAIDVDAGSLARLESLHARYGNVVAFDTPRGRGGVFVNDPALVRQLLLRQHANYYKGPGFERVEMLLGNGLIVSDGDPWRRSRTMIQPVFSRHNVHRLVELMIACTARRAAAWRRAASRGQPLNVTREMNEFALELILRAIFGSDYERHIMAGGDNPFAFLSQVAARDLSVVMKMRRLRELLLTIIKDRCNTARRDDYDFLSGYLVTTDRQGAQFTERELLDELMTLIVAGYETSAGTLNWAWYLLARHPQAAEAVRTEAARYGPEFAGARDDPGLHDMSWTRQVLDETLRLYPPVWLYTRRALQADVLGGYAIPAGTDLYLSPFIMHRSAEFWEDPEQFMPQRFRIDGTHDAGGQPYYPFSLGPRRCLGEYFSFLEMKVHLGMLAQQFRLSPVADEAPGLELGINLRAASDIYLQPELLSPEQ